MTGRTAAAGLAALLIAGCQATREREPAPGAPSLHIVVTDAGHEAPDSVMSGLRHVRFENRGTMIHEAMFVRLPDGMTAAAYSAAVASGEDFPEGAIDCAGPGLTSPGETLDVLDSHDRRTVWIRRAFEPGR